MITVRITKQEQAALVWDDMQNRSTPIASLVARGRRWDTFAATAEDWKRIAVYAIGQADHWTHDIGCGSDEMASIKRDARRCRNVADRIRAAVDKEHQT